MPVLHEAILSGAAPYAAQSKDADEAAQRLKSMLKDCADEVRRTRSLH